jgi:hypothetical protein
MSVMYWVNLENNFKFWITELTIYYIFKNLLKLYNFGISIYIFRSELSSLLLIKKKKKVDGHGVVFNYRGSFSLTENSTCFIFFKTKNKNFSF